jgi:hypothetical protein
MLIKVLFHAGKNARKLASNRPEENEQCDVDIFANLSYH